MADFALLAFNFSLGAAAFFSPCGFPMLPAYLAYYLPRGGDAPPGFARALGRGLVGGLLAGAGAFAVLAVIGGLAAALGAPFKARVLDLELVGALLVAALGVWTLSGRGPSVRVALQPSRKRNAWALAGFGALYAAVAASCVAPLLLGVAIEAFAAPTWTDAALLVAAYAAGLALLLVAVTVLVATAQDVVVRDLKRALPYVQRASGAILLLVAAYLAAYWWRATTG